MSQLPVSSSGRIESALMSNDLAKLTESERLSYYHNVCESVGLNPLTQPFSYIVLNNKLTLYAKRDAADQLRKIHGVSISIDSRKTENDLYAVTVTAKDRTGRQDQAMGVLPIANLKGADLANAMLKCETKAKRRVTLSICGLGILDETEIDDIAKESKAIATNPQIENPFKHNDQKEIDVEPIKESLGDYVVQISKKYKGMKLSEIDQMELESFWLWLENNAKKTGKPLTGNSLEFFEKADAYLKEINQSENILDALKG